MSLLGNKIGTKTRCKTHYHIVVIFRVESSPSYHLVCSLRMSCSKRMGEISCASLHWGHEMMGCNMQTTTVAVTTVAHVCLGFSDLYIRRGYAIIRGRQDQSYLRIGSLPLGCGCHHQRGRALWV
jgi:hypothetical protein